MKITCPKCRNKHPFKLSMLVTGLGVCPFCGNEMQMSDCRQYTVLQIATTLTLGLTVFAYLNEPLEAAVPNVVVRICLLLLIALVPICIVLYFAGPVFYTKFFVNKESINAGKKKKLGR